MSVKERLIAFIEYKKKFNKENGLEKFNISVFCLSIGASKAFISSMRESVSRDKIESIALKYPELDIGWVLTGAGDMINKMPFLSGIQKNKLMLMSSDVLLDQLLGMVQQGIIYPAPIIKEKDELINKLYKEIGSLEEKVKELEMMGGKANVQQDNNAKCADAK